MNFSHCYNIWTHRSHLHLPVPPPYFASFRIRQSKFYSFAELKITHRASIVTKLYWSIACEFEFLDELWILLYMYIYVHIYVRTHIYIYICILHKYIYIYMYTNICIYAHTCIDTHTHLFNYIYTYMYTHKYVYTCTYIYMSISTHIYINVYIYIHIHIYKYIHISIYMHIYTYICTYPWLSLNEADSELGWSNLSISTAIPLPYQFVLYHRDSRTGKQYFWIDTPHHCNWRFLQWQ